MIVSFNWLKKYLNFKDDVYKVAEILTSTGLEVEKVTEKFSSLDHLVVGQIIECESHPNADRLKLTKVDVGNEVKQIVCGANNISKGQHVVVVLTGNYLVNISGEKFKIKKTKIRGEWSEGMICAEDEIGLSENHDGVMVLDDSAKAGMLLSDYLSLTKDYSIEIGLTPNRTDAFGHIGVCRDLFAFYSHRKKRLKFNLPDVSSYKSLNKDMQINLNVRNVIACPSYSGVCIQNLQVKPSPNWLKCKLLSIGLKPINNIVDVTNFVLHETGHPLHAFDYNKISNSKIVVRNAKGGEKFQTLDAREIVLSNEDLVIADSEKPLCLAGVIGGMNSCVDNNTNSIFLESAFFDPTFIRRTSKRHSLNSESSYRFERGVDFNFSKFSLYRAANLIKELCNGIISNEVAYNSKKLKPIRLYFSFSTCDKVLGFKIPHNEILNILKDLSFKVHSQSKDGCEITIPSFRFDVSREIDVVEEVARIYGYNNLPETNKVSFHPFSNNEKSIFDFKQEISTLLVSSGFYEVQNNSLIPEKMSKLFNTSSNEVVKIINPLSQDLSIMRPNMFFSGIETIRHNLNRQTPNVKIFEFGYTYSNLNGRYLENQKLSIFCCGLSKIKNWKHEDQKVDFFYMKNTLDKILNYYVIDLSIFDFNIKNDEYFSQILEYSFESNKVGSVGIFSKKTQDLFGVKKEIYFVDINFDLLIKIIKNKKPLLYKRISKFPSISRDLSLLVDQSIKYSQIQQEINDIDNKFLTQFSLFDLYQGDKIETGKKSLALNFKFQSSKKTLTDSEVDKELYGIYNRLKIKFNLSLRDGELIEY
ncbi:MAG: phenylalanine--tRNA ligase subunit beta [Flavobacteriales bacterium]|nr:phenylalanine--tRNA ligase subunit beta [Flavobacteriales bacterium]|tara:strand:+ start:1894 stop:4332 length:2439 start_codon:yes stop_codon:yes gene_type:complete